MKYIFLTIIRLYRLILSPFLGQQCRFEPTCSRYGEEAIQRYGAWRGGKLTVVRILKCGPWHQGGYDPVPNNNVVKDEK